MRPSSYSQFSTSLLQQSESHVQLFSRLSDGHVEVLRYCLSWQRFWWTVARLISALSFSPHRSLLFFLSIFSTSFEQLRLFQNPKSTFHFAPNPNPIFCKSKKFNLSTDTIQITKRKNNVKEQFFTSWYKGVNGFDILGVEKGIIWATLKQWNDVKNAVLKPKIVAVPIQRRIIVASKWNEERR